MGVSYCILINCPVPLTKQPEWCDKQSWGILDTSKC